MNRPLFLTFSPLRTALLRRPTGAVFVRIGPIAAEGLDVYVDLAEYTHTDVEDMDAFVPQQVAASHGRQFLQVLLTEAPKHR